MCGEENTVERVARMEAYMVALRAAHSREPEAVRRDPCLAAMLRELTAYYESPDWLADFERDARGEFPADMRRGVLSEDGLYDLLDEIGRT